jgi:two-component system, NarL family, nitrate/nitrite response regulator NarL
MNSREINMGSQKLTARELQILEALVQCKSNKQIAKYLEIKESTVEIHLYNIYRKINVQSRVEAVCYAISKGIGRF